MSVATVRGVEVWEGGAMHKRWSGDVHAMVPEVGSLNETRRD